MKKIFCKYCGLELEKNSCTCESFLESRKTKKMIKQTKKCDTCGRTIDDDSKFCAYCGIPIYVNGNNTQLQKELKGIGAIDVLEKYNIKKRTRKNDSISKAIKIIAVALLCFVGTFVYIKMSPIFVNKKDENNEIKQNFLTQATEDVEVATNTQIEKKDSWIKKDGFYYCFDKDGEPVVDDWVSEQDEKGNKKYYYFDVEGKLVINSWIDGEYYVGYDGAMYVDRMTPDGARVDKDGKVIIKEDYYLPNGKETYVYYEEENDETINPSSKKSMASGEIKGVDPNKEYEIFITNLIQQRDIVLKGEDKCNILYYCPIVSGKNKKEVDTINETMIKIFQDKFKPIIKSIPYKYNPIPKSITLNVVEQRNLNENRFMFIISGSTVPRKGLPEKIKIRFTYDRKSKTMTVLDISDE